MKAFEKLSDIELIEQIIKGDASLFEILIRRNNPVLYKTGRSYNFTHHDVEDLMQETYINAFLNLSKFENKSSFRTWLIRIMINQCLAKMQRSAFKNEKAGESITNEKITPMFSTTNSSDTAMKISNKELNQILEESITRLPIDYRIVFSLREINGLSVAETSEALNITESNVKVRLNRAKNMLRNDLEKLYSREDIFEFNLVYCDKVVARVMDQITNICKPL
jgi:RNA polymerase sigma-70 factor (ECF subfamily)